MKPLGIKAYGHIPHLIGSRVGPGDHTVSEGQHRICTEKARDRHDEIFVEEKLDGSCVAVALVGGKIIPLVRAGYVAWSSPYEQHHLFAWWVRENEERFRAVLREGERLVGEWLAQAHGTRYVLPHEPFVVFDLMRGHEREPREVFWERVKGLFVVPRLIHRGGPISIGRVLELLEPSGHGAVDPVEGAVWRVERREKVDFLAKYVRPDKVDGRYLPEYTGTGPVWNWMPATQSR
ncbi:hypothetical protein SAMN00808754_1403 [Thermanaeromonas toyohensis ToBE]|uniref:RNA ligase domain-containing protein n=1 Tax=Thermanaeromonas toyohensis ToBE TaxID=698762 RepID=A0A1W1VSN4_9FIRM|nr:RNA ligase family protein [Thermanaeromonas toyohensis]SMB96111.1 hypothetical protein SAMN00808754_1403 [Thermanaeromonas toyohensis ToBE]